ncbi:dynamin family protein [Pseudoneobacillus rhizosphaerae]|uniref:GTPase Der n=1 Tax=Pseudoneobacillus rhizosphaerae TaxID=2880968 RepID=A0A9C7G6Q0_9BACI|nr:dynamin family protein [Pseudoneobacillus rhizosphaerae]CAG9606578.1 GTPase Der [Pseudoneobacillus rhizosphaerae]
METLEIQAFEGRKNNLLGLLERTRAYFEKIGNDDKVKSFESLYQNVQNGEFVIVVVGEFSAGKSTFLNALMGEKYLPSFTSETTATINYLKHTNKSLNGRGLEVVFKDQSKGVAYGDATQKDIEKYVSTSSTTDVVNEVEYVNLFLDSPFLEKGVMLVDSPGLNGVAEGHQEVTEHQIEKSHACIFMFNSTQPGKKSDFEVLSKLTKKFNTIILVLNQIDKIKKDEETVEEVVDRLKRDYAKQFEGSAIPEIWPVAAYPALVANSTQNLEYPDNTGKRDHSPQDRARYLDASRIEPFKNRLWKFITQGEKAQQEMLAPVEKVKSALLDRRTDIENQIFNLTTLEDAQEVEAQMNFLQEEIEKLEGEMQKSKQGIDGVLKEKLSDSINQLKSGAQNIQQRYARRIENWTELDDVEYEFDEIQNRASRDFDGMMKNAFDTFMTEFEDTMRLQYVSFMEQVQSKVQESHSILEKMTVPKPEEFVFDATQFHVGLDKFEEQRRAIEAELAKFDGEIERVQKDFIQAELIRSDKEALERRLEGLKEKEMFYIQALGARPAVNYYTEFEDTKQGRGGILGWTADLFIGKKNVQTQKKVMDDSLVKSYEAERESYRNAILQSEDSIKKQMEDLESKVEKSPEVLEYERQQIERQKEAIRQKRESYEQQFKEEFQKKNRRALLKVKHQMGDYISELTKQGEETFKNSLGKKRKELTEIVINVVDAKIRKQILDKEKELQELADTLKSSAAEIQKKITAFEEEKSDVIELLSEVVSLEMEIQSLTTDSIQTSSVTATIS